jgi:hypothetical protein
MPVVSAYQAKTTTVATSYIRLGAIVVHGLSPSCLRIRPLPATYTGLWGLILVYHHFVFWRK